jgi:hypothetical protein
MPVFYYVQAIAIATDGALDFLSMGKARNLKNWINCKATI